MAGTASDTSPPAHAMAYWLKVCSQVTSGVGAFVHGFRPLSGAGRAPARARFDCRAKRAACALLAVNNRAFQVEMAWAARGR